MGCTSGSVAQAPTSLPQAVAPPTSQPSPPQAPRTLKVARWTIAPQMIDCMGLVPMRCLQYRDSPSGPWKAHTGPIEGFEFVPGTEVDIEIKMVEVPRPMADGPWLRVVWVQNLAPPLATPPPQKTVNFTLNLQDTLWQLKSLTGMDLPANAAEGDKGAKGDKGNKGAMGAMGAKAAAIDVRFDAQQPMGMSGFAGVNRYNSRAHVQGDEMRIDPVASTRMAGEHAAMALERHFLQQLQQTRRYSLEGPELRFFNAAGQLLMVWRQP